MNVKIDLDVAENILKAYARRGRDQIRVYGILLGSLSADNTVHIKSCINGFIYESKETEEGGSTSVQFKRLNDTILNNLLTSYQSNFPDHLILGGFSTDKDHFMELFYLNVTINEIDSKTFPNWNKLLVLLDPNHKGDSLNFGIQAFTWTYDEVNKVMAYSTLPHQLSDTKIGALSLHSNSSNSDELLLHLRNSNITEGSTFKEIMETVIKSVDDELRLKPNTTEGFSKSNLYYFKRQLLIVDRFLAVYENLLDTMTPQNQNALILSEVDYLVSDLTNCLDNAEIQAACLKEYKDNHIIDSLTSLLDVQVKLTEKINKLNL